MVGSHTPRTPAKAGIDKIAREVRNEAMKKVEEGREDPAIPDAGKGAVPPNRAAPTSDSDASSRGRGSRDYLAEVTSLTSGLSETSFSPAVGQLAKALSAEGTHGCRRRQLQS